MPAITVDQQKLVLNAFATIFQNNLVASDAVTWKQYDTELDDKNGLKVSEQVTPRYTVTQTVNGVNDLTATGTQDSVFGSEQFSVNRVFGTSMGWADFVKIRDIGEARESQALRMAAINLAEAVDSYILGTIQTAANNWLGNPANGIATWTDFVQGYTRLKEEGVDDSNLRGILTYADRQTLGSAIQNLTAPDALVTGAYRQGFTGEIGGLPVMFTQQLQAFTTGSRAATGAGTVNGANQNVDYKSVAVSGAPGQFMTQTLNIKTSASGTETVNAGDVFTIANVYAYDNRSQTSTGRLQQFTVVSGGTAVAGAVQVRIFPAIIVPNVGSTAADQKVNAAHATVDSVPGAAAAITWLGTASTVYKPRVILQKDAIVINTAPLIMPATGKAMNKTLTKVPLTFRMWQHSDFNTGNHSVRFDAALTANVRDRRRIVRINGN